MIEQAKGEFKNKNMYGLQLPQIQNYLLSQKILTCLSQKALYWGIKNSDGSETPVNSTEKASSHIPLVFKYEVHRPDIWPTVKVNRVLQQYRNSVNLRTAEFPPIPNNAEKGFGMADPLQSLQIHFKACLCSLKIPTINPVLTPLIHEKLAVSYE